MNLKNEYVKGDSHRFGKRVSFLLSDPFIKKPRDTKIEYLFLSEESPLKQYQDFLGLGFSAKISLNPNNEGIVENLNPFVISDSEIEDNADNLFKLAGQFLATATLFGLNDLHVENILFLKRNNRFEIAPVDLEIILYKFATSAETCLHPSPKASSHICGYARLIPHISLERVKFFTDAFINSYNQIVLKLPEILNIIDTTLENSPIRMLIRPTELYALYLKTLDESIFKNEPIPLSEEEKIQLRAKDIPYFFSFYKDRENLLFYSEENKITKACEVAKHPSINRHLAMKPFLLNPDNLLKLKIQSLCHIIYYLTNNIPLEEFEISGIYFNSHRQKSQLKIKFEANDITLTI